MWTVPLAECFYQHLSHSNNSRAFQNWWVLMQLCELMKVCLPLLEWPRAPLLSPPKSAERGLISAMCLLLFMLEIRFLSRTKDCLKLDLEPCSA